jgi:hypothetical protein
VSQKQCRWLQILNAPKVRVPFLQQQPLRGFSLDSKALLTNIQVKI